jgi:hypothetical protein
MTVSPKQSRRLQPKFMLSILSFGIRNVDVVKWLTITR